MSLLRSLNTWFKAVGYLLTGKLDDARRALDTNPQVVKAKYDEVIHEKTGRIQQYKQAVAQLIAQQEAKLAKVRQLTDEMTKLQNLKAGALAKAKETVAALQKNGADQPAIEKDEEYQRCLSAYNDFSSTLAEKQARVDELENDINEYGARISDHKVQLQHLMREIEKVRSEAADAVADFITAREEKEINDALSGIAEDGAHKDLSDLRSLRNEVKAEARVSRELAGTDHVRAEAEFLEYARASSANNEFAALVGLAKPDAAPASPAAPEQKSASQLPE